VNKARHLRLHKPTDYTPPRLTLWDRTGGACLRGVNFLFGLLLMAIGKDRF